EGVLLSRALPGRRVDRAGARRRRRIRARRITSSWHGPRRHRHHRSDNLVRPQQEPLHGQGRREADGPLPGAQRQPQSGRAVDVVAVVLGWVLYRAVVVRVVDRDLFTSTLATFGLSLLLQQLSNSFFGADVRTAEPGLGTLMLLGRAITVARIKLVAFAAALLTGGVMVLFLKHSRMGQAIRATAQNPRAARVMGVDTGRVFAWTFALNAAICGACGALVAMTWIVHPYLGLPYTVRSFMIVIVAGMGNVSGVLAAAMALGVAENFAGFVFGAEYQAAFVFTLLVAILVARRFWLARQRRHLA